MLKTLSTYFYRISSKLDRNLVLKRTISTTPAMSTIEKSFDLPKRYKGTKESVWLVAFIIFIIINVLY